MRWLFLLDLWHVSTEPNTLWIIRIRSEWHISISAWIFANFSLILFGCWEIRNFRHKCSLTKWTRCINETNSIHLASFLQIANFKNTAHSSIAQFQMSLAHGILCFRPLISCLFHLSFLDSLSLFCRLHRAQYLHLFSLHHRDKFVFRSLFFTLFHLCRYIGIARCHCIDAIIRRLNCSRWVMASISAFARLTLCMYLCACNIVFCLLFILHEWIFDTCSFSRCRDRVLTHTYKYY